MDISDEVCGDCLVLPMCKDFCPKFREWANQWIIDARNDLNSPRLLYLKSVDLRAYQALEDFVKKKDGVCMTHPRTNMVIAFDGNGKEMKGLRMV